MYIYRVFTWENGIRDFTSFENMINWIKLNPYSMREYKKIIVYKEEEE